MLGFTYLDAKSGYRAAIAELDERHGDMYVIVNAYVKRALNWPCIKADNAMALDDFVMFLTVSERIARWCS